MVTIDAKRLKTYIFYVEIREYLIVDKSKLKLLVSYGLYCSKSGKHEVGNLDTT